MWYFIFDFGFCSDLGIFDVMRGCVLVRFIVVFFYYKFFFLNCSFIEFFIFVYEIVCFWDNVKLYVLFLCCGWYIWWFVLIWRYFFINGWFEYCFIDFMNCFFFCCVYYFYDRYLVIFFISFNCYFYFIILK